MTSTKTISLDFNVPGVVATITFEVPAQPEAPGDRAQGWYLADEDAAAAMWGFR